MSDEKKPLVPWTEGEKWDLAIQIIEKFGTIPWDDIKLNGRTKKACVVMFDKEKAKVKKARAAAGGDGGADVGTQTPKTPKRKADGEAGGKKARCPKKKAKAESGDGEAVGGDKRMVKAEAEEQDEIRYD